MLSDNGIQRKSHHTGVVNMHCTKKITNENFIFTLNVQFDKHLIFTTLIDLIK